MFQTKWEKEKKQNNMSTKQRRFKIGKKTTGFALCNKIKATCIVIRNNYIKGKTVEF